MGWALTAVLTAISSAASAAEFNVVDYTRLALDRSPEVRQARAAAGQARAEWGSQLAQAAMPSLSITGLAYPYGHNPLDSYRFNHWRLSRRSDIEIDSKLTWNLFNSFKDYQKVRSSGLARQSAESALLTALQTRAFEAIRSFYDLNVRSQLLEVARQNLASQAEQYRQTQDLYRNGMKSLSDMLKGETDWRSSQLRLIQAEAETKTALVAFNLLVDRPGLAPAALKTDLSPGATELPSLEADLARAEAQRPEIAQARQDAARARVVYEQAIQGALPTLSVDATWNREHLGAPSTVPNPHYQLGLSLSLPVNFNIVSQWLSVRAAKKSRAQAEEALEAAKRSVRREAHGAHINLERATLAFAIAAQKEDIANRNLELVSNQYRQGAADAIRLAQAQLDYLDARNERTQALNDIFINRARYRLAVGDPVW